MNPNKHKAVVTRREKDDGRARGVRVKDQLYGDR